VWGKIADLSDDAVDVFDHALTGGPLPRGLHSWDGPTGVHGRYNEAVAELFDDFLKQKGLTPGQVSRLEAEEFVQVVLKSRKAQVWRLLRPIRGFLRGANFKGRLFCVDPFSVGIGLVELLFQDEAEAKQDFDYQLWRMGFGPEPGAVVPGV